MNTRTKTYLDYSATTPLDRRVLEAMMPYFQEDFGNPSSIHAVGQRAEAAVENAREIVAAYLNCTPSEVLFTSGGTESDNAALRGVAFAARQQRGAQHILISPVEHHAVTLTGEQLAKVHGFELEYLPVDEFGMVHPEEVAARLRPDTAIVSVIYGNNEIGTVNPLAEIGASCRAKGIPFHTDAVQAGAYLPLDVDALNVDLMSIGAHKFYGPKGVGVLYVRKGTEIIPAQSGGAHEFGMRAGTPNVPYIVGMAKALQLAQKKMAAHNAHLYGLRDGLIGKVLEETLRSRLTGHPSQRLSHHASFAFKDVDGNALLAMLDVAGFACSSGSACRTGLPEPSETLLALGLSPDWALGSLRVTLGRSTTARDVQLFVRALKAALAGLQGGS